MNALQTALNNIVAKTYALTVLTHQAHWNVAGDEFFQLHEAFGDQYEAMFSAVDTVAEQLRAIGAQALPDLDPLIVQLGDLPKLKSEDPVPELLAAHEDLLLELEAGVELAKKDLATQQILLDRVLWHGKAIWMLKSYLAAEAKED